MHCQTLLASRCDFRRSSTLQWVDQNLDCGTGECGHLRVDLGWMPCKQPPCQAVLGTVPAAALCIHLRLGDSLVCLVATGGYCCCFGCALLQAHSSSSSFPRAFWVLLPWAAMVNLARRQLVAMSQLPSQQLSWGGRQTELLVHNTRLPIAQATGSGVVTSNLAGLGIIT